MKAKFVFILVCVTILSACAKVSSPTGGAMDTTPPQPISANPPVFSTFFESSEFVIEFDEYIKADDLANQLIISPPLKNKPVYRVRGRKLYLNWDEPLQSNATYQFNFGKGVADVNESNANTSLSYVFSTGSYIDSLSIGGRAVSANTNEPLALASVMLYRNLSDTLIGRVLPDYFTLTNEDGSFLINYLPPDTFNIFILFEKNNNYFYDGPPEEIGFINQTVLSQIADSSIQYIIPVFIENDTLQYIESSAGKDFGYYETIFNIPAADPEISFRVGNSEEYLQAINLLSSTGDTLRSWVTLPQPIPEEVEVIIKDGIALNDTVIWYIETDEKFAKKTKLSVSSNTSRGKLDLGKNIELKFSNPLEYADSSLIELYEDSLTSSSVRFEKYDLFRRLRIYHDFEKKKKYLLVANAGAFKDVYGNYSDSLGFAFDLQDAEFYGTLKLRLDFEGRENSKDAVLQLTDAKGVMLTEMILDGRSEVDFGRLQPAKYGLKIIFDENGNGKWDPGDIATRTLPEVLSIYPELVEVRSNWDLELEWKPSTPFD
jgi:hypothetical protein